MTIGADMLKRHLATVILFLLVAAGTGAFSLPASASAPDLGLMEAASLKEAESRWIVLDGRPKSAWEAGRIPGSRSFSWQNYTRTDEKGAECQIFSPGELASALGAMGIDENTPVVVYGDADKSWGGEGWAAWVLAWLGHKGPVRLLAGGIQAWRGRGFPLAGGPEQKSLTRAVYQTNMRPDLTISTVELERQKESLVIIDVRSTFERLRGKIPGSVHIFWEEFFSGAERRPLAAADLKKLLSSHGVDTSRPVVYYCYGGVRSGYAWLVHQLAGLPTARNYTGGIAAWRKRAVR